MFYFQGPRFRCWGVDVVGVYVGTHEVLVARMGTHLPDGTGCRRVWTPATGWVIYSCVCPDTPPAGGVFASRGRAQALTAGLPQVPNRYRQTTPGGARQLWPCNGGGGRQKPLIRRRFTVSAGSPGRLEIARSPVQSRLCPPETKRLASIA